MYPTHPENNVSYTYGLSTDVSGFNRKGRLVLLEDASGAQEYKYGKQGEVNEIRRTILVPNQSPVTYVSQWEYDSWNRIKTMTYPDGEVLTYAYNTAGLLTDVSGTKNGSPTVYASNIKYDTFEQRTEITYGNGSVTKYTYDAKSRNLTGLNVSNGNTALMNNAYTYDQVNNVTKIVNNVTAGVTQTYNYDKLYRLTSAHGTFTGSGDKFANYDLTMSYDALHNIVRKTQTVNQQNISIDGHWKSNYDLTYEYAANPQQISTIADVSTSGMNNNNLVTTTSTKAYTYDANGNLLEVRSQAITGNSDRRRLLWDEENRLLAVNDNGYVSNYCYDASGERTVKCSGVGVGVYVNGGYSGGLTSTGGYSVYVSPYAVVTNGATLSKHFYVGTQRVATKLCDAAALNAQSETKAGGKDFTAATVALNSALAVRYDSLGVKYTAASVVSSAATTASTTESLYYYHPDHLGSSSLVTDASGAVSQHIEYIPFGEVFVEERKNQWNTPYKFNAKEQDEETGLYYYGARYYDPRTSVWISVDPLAEKYFSTGSYVYCLNNPVKFFDPDGRSTHTDHDGKVIAVYDDKNLGVYRHSAKSLKGVDVDKTHLSTKGAEKMGETQYWDEFMSHDTKNGNPKKADGHIMFNESWDKDIDILNKESIDMGLELTAPNSFPGEHFDIKADKKLSPYGPLTGKKLNGKYASAESAGNYLAGLNGATATTMVGQHISSNFYMRLAGALHAINNFTDISKSPYYGEIPYAGRRIMEGFYQGAFEQRQIRKYW